ncbi:MAG: hypothetical protein CMI60_12515 [Parvibaculum sp.]|nr:hypothetical protein [Parvibaculum sp.]
MFNYCINRGERPGVLGPIKCECCGAVLSPMKTSAEWIYVPKHKRGAVDTRYRIEEGRQRMSTGAIALLSTNTQGDNDMSIYKAMDIEVQGLIGRIAIYKDHAQNWSGEVCRQHRKEIKDEFQRLNDIPMNEFSKLGAISLGLANKDWWTNYYLRYNGKKEELEDNEASVGARTVDIDLASFWDQVD